MAGTEEPVPWWYELPVWVVVYAAAYLLVAGLPDVPLELRILGALVIFVSAVRGAALAWDRGTFGRPDPRSDQVLRTLAAGGCTAVVAAFALLVAPAAGAGLAALLAVNLAFNLRAARGTGA